MTPSLTIGELAERTGLSPTTLRMWEQRHGFPTPVRLPSGHRRYEESDEFGTWAAEARSTGEFLGWFHFRLTEGSGVDLGYRLRRAAWNKGYATEGSRALIRRGFAEAADFVRAGR